MWPILFTIPQGVPLFGGTPFFSYGILLGLSVVVGWYLTLHLAERDGLDRRQAARTIVAGVVCALLGARGLHFVANPESFHGWRSLLDFDGGGLVAWGGYLGGLLGGLAWVGVTKQLRFWRFVDHAAPAFALGLGLTRVGCFLYGCDFGRRTDGPLGVRFAHWAQAQIPWVGGECIPDEARCGPLAYCSPHTLHCEGAGAPAWALHQKLGVIEAGAAMSAAVHPVQLYESALGFGLFGVLLWLHRRRRFEGQTMLTFLGLYALGRFGLELLREDPERGAVWSRAAGDVGWWGWLLVDQPMPDAHGGMTMVSMLTTSQLISLVMVVLVGVGAWWLRRQRPMQP